MQLFSWLYKRLTGRSHTRGTSARKPTRRFRPQLETLESRLTPSLSTLASFSGLNGGVPQGNLIMDVSGNLYGTTSSGGASGDGSVYEVAQGSGTITTLASFNGSNGSNPVAGLVMDGLGNLYGTTDGYGSGPQGTVFELVKGSGTITTLASFNGSNGSTPMGSLIMDSGGNLYGTTYYGSANYGAGDNYGTVFELAKGSGTITTLASFNGFNGANPAGGLVMDSNGNLFGTTYAGGLGAQGNGEISGGYGTVFELAKGSSTITTLIQFTPYDDPAAAVNPDASLITDGSGNFYGTTYGGGASGAGTVFEFSPMKSFTVSFNGANGANPEASLAIDGNGNLFGTTYGGGASGDGTVFEVTQGSGTITTLASFNGTNGANPQGGLFVDASGNVYGTTNSGGASNAGTLFELPGAAAPRASYQISSFPSSTTAGAPQTFTLTVLNPDGTIDTGYRGTVHFTSTDPQAVLPADYTFKAADAGVHTFTATLKTAGPQSITAAATLGITIAQADITVNPAAASYLIITGPSTATRGVAFSITVTAYDAYGNVATRYTGTVQFKSSDKTASLPANYTFTASEDGAHTFTGLVLNRKVKQSITATDILSSTITGSLSVEVF